MLFMVAAVAIGAFVSGCATTQTAAKAPKVDENARWVVVSTNDPVSSARMERNSSRVPPRYGSFLLSPEGQQARQELETNGIPPMITKKMLDGEVLTLADIEDLGRYKASEATVLKYLQASSAIYILNSDDVNRLQQAGVGKTVIDYMLATPNQRPVQVVRRYRSYYPYPYYDPWWGYSGFYPYSYYSPHYYHHHHYGGGHYRSGGGLRVYRPR